MEFVVVHLGAGHHSDLRRKKYKSLSDSCLTQTLDLLLKGSTSEDACVFGCQILENNPITNAGTGSNLTSIGTVEMDASIISSNKRKFASVGSISNIKNPIKIAKHLYDNLDKIDPFGRSNPRLIVGNTYIEKNLPHLIIDSNNLITKRSLALYNHWNDQISLSPSKVSKKQVESQVDVSQMNEEDENENINDTVGIICGDKYGSISIATSSGGVLYKQPGRLGLASLPGPGLWCQSGNNVNSSTNNTNNIDIAVCCSGLGEDIMALDLSRFSCNKLSSQYHHNNNIMIHDILKSILLKESNLINLQNSNTNNIIYAGIIALIRDENGINIGLAHSTQSMIIGYISKLNKPKMLFSHLNDSKIATACAII